MLIKLNRFTAILLFLLISPIAVPILLYRWVTGTGYNPVYQNTVEGDPFAYAGDKPIIISVWAKWAGIWKTSTDEIIQQVRSEYGDRCEFGYIEITNLKQYDEIGVNVAPTVIVRHKGIEVDRFPNMFEREPLESALRKVLTHSPEHRGT